MIAINHGDNGSSSVVEDDDPGGGGGGVIPSDVLIMTIALSVVISIRMIEMFERSETHTSPGSLKVAMNLELSGP